MRLSHRTAITVYIAPRTVETGAMGSREEAFSDERTACRAVCLPSGGGLIRGDYGIRSGESVRLLIEKDSSVNEGDAVFIGAKGFIVRRTERWAMHTELLCEAMT